MRHHSRSTTAGALLALAVLLALPTLVAPDAASAQKGDGVQLRPANDDFSRGALLSLLHPRQQQVEQGTFGATVEGVEPLHCGGTATVWFTLPPAAGGFGLLRLDTAGSDYDTTLGVYRGVSLDRLKLVDCNDDAAPGVDASALSFLAVPGETYHVQVGGALDAVGHLRLRVQDDLLSLP